MQISNVTGLSFSRLTAPVSLTRPTGSAEAVLTAQETSRTAAPPRSTDRPGVRLASPPLISSPFGPLDTLIVSPTLNSERLESVRNGFRQSIRDRLGDLSDRVSALLAVGDFNTRRTRVSRPEILSVTPGNKTPLDQVNITSTRLSQGQVLASDKFTAGSPLNLSGRFLINGTTVTVSVSDGLSNIRDKINRGEDSNGNGRLDGPEDLNANGQIDIIEVAGGTQGPGLFIVEDKNGNGRLDPDEDANANDRLDGGTKENKVIAGVIGDRLTLTSETGGASTIALSDPDDVLLALGFFELNAKGRPIQKEAQFDFDRQTPTNLNTTPQTASLEIDGVTRESDDNEFTSAIADAVVELRQTTDKGIEVRVRFDSDQAVEAIENLTDEFNSVVGELNRAQRGDPPTVADPDIPNVQSQLVSVQVPATSAAPSAEPDADQTTFDRITPPVSGQPLKDSGVLNFGEFFISDSAQSIENGLRTEPPKNTNVLPDPFQQIGIRVLEDNTLEINKPALEQAFENDFEKVRDLFFKEDTGLLAQLQERLDRLLDTDFGPLTVAPDPAIAPPATNSNNPFRAAIEALAQSQPARNLLAIV